MTSSFGPLAPTWAAALPEPILAQLMRLEQCVLAQECFFPPAEQVLRAFNETSFDEVREAAEPPMLSSAVPNWSPGDVIPLGSRSLVVVGKRDNDADPPPVLVVEEHA
jgi:hypothetical protein